MSDSLSRLDQLIADTEIKHRRTRIRAVILTVIPFAFAMAAVLFVWWLINSADAELDNIRAETDNALENYNKAIKDLDRAIELQQVAENERDDTLVELSKVEGELNSTKVRLERIEEQSRQLERKIEELRAELDKTIEFRGLVFRVDPGDFKVLYGSLGVQSAVLRKIWEIKEKNVRWQRYEISPELEFNSVAFAEYVLRNTEVTQGNLRSDDLHFSQDELMELLSTPIKRDELKSGDMVFYKGGFSMFYFETDRREPFVIGMTPFGIQTMKLDFGPEIIGFRKIEYSKNIN